MRFDAEIKDFQNIIENKLSEYVKEDLIPQKRIFEAMEYSLLSGGKRLRPVIMLAAASIFDDRLQDILPFACAIEMIHTYSLIHDDLPAMDNDVLRRGKPTNHIKFDEATAILAGDALLNMAFEITTEYKCENIPPERILKAVNVLSKSSGAYGMIGGQMIDIESEEKSLSLEELTHLHLLKTGAIIIASGVVGAILSGADENEVEAIKEYCKNLGIAFQIRDDILDVVGSEEVLGKPIGSDMENKKNTYISLMGIDEAELLVEEYTKKAISSLLIFGKKADILVFLAESLTKRDH